MKFGDKAKKYGFKTSKEYRDHLARLKGYKDYNDYRKHWRALRINNYKEIIYREYP